MASTRASGHDRDRMLEDRFPASDALKSMQWVERSEESLRRHGEWIEA